MGSLSNDSRGSEKSSKEKKKEKRKRDIKDEEFSPIKKKVKIEEHIDIEKENNVVPTEILCNETSKKSKKKKKKGKSESDQNIINQEESCNESTKKAKKKKKEKPEGEPENNHPNEIINEESIENDILGKQKKKKKKKDRENEVKENRLEDVEHAVIKQNYLKSDKVETDNEIKAEPPNHIMTEIKEDLLDSLDSDAEDSNRVRFVKDVVKKCCLKQFNFQGESQREILKAVSWILESDIQVDRLNQKVKRNFVDEKHTSTSRIVQEFGCEFSFFTEAEDSEILDRLNFLVKNKVISGAQALCDELKDKQRIHKHAGRIIGLYLCQNLQNRLAYYVTDRMLRLVAKLTKKDEPTKSSVRIPWTYEEENFLAKCVLFDRASRRFIRVEKLDEKTVDWANVTERLIEFGRENSTRQNVRERWTRVIKGMLVEDEQEVEVTYSYRKRLIEHVMRLNVGDKREIRWKEVAQHFPPKTSSMLSQDFWNLIRWNMKGDRTFEQTLEVSHAKLEKRCQRNVNSKMIEEKEDNRSKFLDWYRGLDFVS